MRALVFAAALAVTGCGAATEVEHAVRSAATFAALAEPVVVEAYRAAQLACLETSDPPSCVATVRAKWKPVIDSYDAFRTAWCVLDAAVADARCAP